MGKYATLQFVTREMRDDVDEIGDYVVFVSRSKAEGEGYHPVGEPRIEWHEITQLDIDMDLWSMREAGIEDPVSPWRAGDWRVRVIFQIAEDEPVR